MGGTGFVGRHIIEKLCAKGIHVRVLARRREQHRDLLVLPTVELIEANIHDPAQLRAQLQGMDAVINLVAILNEGKAGDFERVHVELPRLLANTCKALGVPRLLHMSALGADVDGPSRYLQSKGRGEAAVRQIGADSSEPNKLQVTVFRPSIIFGQGDHFFGQFAALLGRIPLVFPLIKPAARFQPVWVEDVATAFLVALSQPQTYGQAYDLCGPKVYSFRELIVYIRQLTGYCRLLLPLPDWAARLQASVLERLPGKLLTRDNLGSLSRDNVCGGDCFPAIFGITPTPLEAVVPACVLEKKSRSGRYTSYRDRYRS